MKDLHLSKGPINLKDFCKALAKKGLEDAEIGTYYTKYEECSETHNEYEPDKVKAYNKSTIKKKEKSITYREKEQQPSKVVKAPEKEAINKAPSNKGSNYVIYNNAENIQSIPDLAYVAFNSHKNLGLGIAYAPESHQLIFNQVGEYNIDYLAVTQEIAYFALNLNNKTLSPNSYIKGSSGLYQQDSGSVKVKVTSVPSYLRLQNISGKSVSLAPEKINASLIIKKVK